MPTFDEEFSKAIAVVAADLKSVKTTMAGRSRFIGPRRDSRKTRLPGKVVPMRKKDAPPGLIIGPMR